MTWLVVASEQDAAAHWAADGLLATGMFPVTVVTDSDLVGATWRHQVGDGGVRTWLMLADGRMIDSATVRGTLNRVTHAPMSLVMGISHDDRIYAFQETTGLVLSWLASLPGPVLNPPDPRGLCGAWRTTAEWALLAGEAGFQTLPVTSDPEAVSNIRNWQTWAPFAPIAEDIVIVGKEVFANSDLHPKTVAACHLLSERAAAPILGLAFDGDHLASITPLPDLRSGGEDLIAALAVALSAP